MNNNKTALYFHIMAAIALAILYTPDTYARENQVTPRLSAFNTALHVVVNPDNR